MSTPRSISPWWALVLVPLALGTGHLLALIPTSPRAGDDTAATSGPIAQERTEHGARPSRGLAGSGVMPPATAIDQAPIAETPAVTRGPIRWRTYADAMDESRRSGKPVLLEFSAEWCPCCQQMKQEMFDSPGHARAIEGAVLPVTLVDRRREDGSNPAEIDELQKEYGINAFPTLVIVSPATGRSAKSVGFPGEDESVDWITRAARSVRG